MSNEFYTNYTFTDLWDDRVYALKNYVEEPPTDELIKSIEDELGYKLPFSYISLMKIHNGGIPKKSCYPTSTPTSWSDNHIQITGISGIGRNKTYSLCGEMGSNFMIEEWGYPNIGIVICHTPTAGHDVVMLDYRKCGSHGEPEVVHVDQEFNYKITFLAENFVTFINGLVDESDMENK